MEKKHTFSRLQYQPLLDSALPIGAFSHSFGLETLVHDGRIETLDHLERYIRVMLTNAWAPSDCMAIKAVYDFGEQDDWEYVWQLDHRLHVQRMARESREGLQKMGRRLLRLGAEMYPALPWQSLQDAIRNGKCPGTYPLVHGWVSYHLAVPMQTATEGYLYNCVLSTINCALRLMSIGQTEGQKLLVRLLPACTNALELVMELRPEDCYTTMPQAELAMMRHESLYSRLFMS
jgi:urease accessory protein